MAKSKPTKSKAKTPAKPKTGKPKATRGPEAASAARPPQATKWEYTPPPPVRVVGPSLARVRKAFEKYAPLLRGVKSVKRVSYGAKRSDAIGGYGFESAAHAADPTVRYAILVYVESKPEAPMDPQADGFIPPDIDGVPTDVIAEPGIARIEPKRVVLSTPAGPVEGALGIVATDTSDPTAAVSFYALTNAHVACGPNLFPAPTGDLQVFDSLTGTPLTVDTSTTAQVRSGFFPAGGVNVDAAAVPLVLDAVTAARVFGRVPSFGKVVAAPFKGSNPNEMSVVMFSQMTNRQVFGRVVDPNFTAFVDMGGGVSKLLTNLLQIRSVDPASVDSNLPFGEHGDSGSIVVIRIGQRFRGIGLYVGTQADEPVFGMAQVLLRSNSAGGTDPNCVLERMEVSF